MAATRKLDDDTKAILRNCTLQGNVLVLPPGQLERPRYLAFDKAMKALGGAWNRKAGGHVFSFDPAELIAQAKETGEVVDRKQTLQFFETPAVVVEQMMRHAKARHARGLGRLDGRIALEPSAGHGRLVLPLLQWGATVTAVEIDEHNSAELDRRVVAAGMTDRFELITADFLQAKHEIPPCFDLILMNPPFTRGQDAEHINQAYLLLAPGGRLVAICGRGSLTRQDGKASAFQQWIERKATLNRPLTEGIFKDSGTLSAANLLVIDKPEGGER
jgi:predicted RNA methylase